VSIFHGQYLVRVPGAAAKHSTGDAGANAAKQQAQLKKSYCRRSPLEAIRLCAQLLEAVMRFKGSLIVLVQVLGAFCSVKALKFDNSSSAAMSSCSGATAAVFVQEAALCERAGALTQFPTEMRGWMYGTMLQYHVRTHVSRAHAKHHHPLHLAVDQAQQHDHDGRHGKLDSVCMCVTSTVAVACRHAACDLVAHPKPLH
jgi:hypothetical protein